MTEESKNQGNKKTGDRIQEYRNTKRKLVGTCLDLSLPLKK